MSAPADGPAPAAKKPSRGRLDRAVLRRWFIAGLLVWVPLGVTLLVLRSLVNLLDTSLWLIPSALRIPGLGVILSVALVLGTGALLANYIGVQLLNWLEAALNRIPLVRSLYGGVKKLAETLFSESSTSFKKVVLVEWPRKGVWSVGFQAGEPIEEVSRKTGRDLLTVFVPTTPNPTSGFIMCLPREEVQVLDMSVEDGMRYVLSLGVVTPSLRRPPSAAVPGLERGA